MLHFQFIDICRHNTPRHTVLQFLAHATDMRCLLLLAASRSRFSGEQEENSSDWLLCYISTRSTSVRLNQEELKVINWLSLPAEGLRAPLICLDTSCLNRVTGVLLFTHSCHRTRCIVEHKKL
jgi:hypothetical protein